MNRKSKQEVLAGLGAVPRELPDIPHAELPVDHAKRDQKRTGRRGAPLFSNRQLASSGSPRS